MDAIAWILWIFFVVLLGAAILLSQKAQRKKTKKLAGQRLLEKVIAEYEALSEQDRIEVDRKANEWTTKMNWCENQQTRSINYLMAQKSASS